MELYSRSSGILTDKNKEFILLLLSRRTRETIMIGDDIQVELVMIDKNSALIGIRAPRDVQVHRQEVYDKNKAILNTRSRSSFKEQCK